MKKPLSVALSIMLALTLLCSASFAEAVDFTGTWYTRLYGMEMTFTLNEGGSYTAHFDGEDESDETEGVWEATSTGIIFDKGTDEEVVLDYDAQANTLSGITSGVELVFSRESIAAFELAPARADAAPEEYDGQWVATILCLGDVQAKPQEFQFELRLTVEDGQSILTLVVDGESADLSIVPEFSDGAMILTIEEEDDSAAYTVVCQMLEDGSMSVTFPEEFFGDVAVFALERN